MIYPDIEIYVKEQPTEDVLSWIKERVGITAQEELRRDGKRVFDLTVGDPAYQCLIICRVNGDFSSIWFNSTRLPWTSDVDCAVDCATALDTEVRCQDPDSEVWIRVRDQQQSTIDW